MPPLRRSLRRARTARVLALLLPLAVAAGLLVPASASAVTDGAISGTVIEKTGKKGIAGLYLCVGEVEGPEEKCVATESSGAYKVNELPPGSYHVNFSDENCTGSECIYLDFLTQYYDDKSNYEEAGTVAVSSGKTFTGVNAEMVTGGTLEGQVKPEVEGIDACAESTNGEYFERCVYTDEEGFYVIPGLPAGSYVISFTGGSQCPKDDCRLLNYVTEYYGNTTNYEAASPVTVGLGEEKHDGETQIHGGATVEGRVTAATGGAPVHDDEVCPEVAGSASYADCASTNSNGEYQLVGLEGEYAIEFSAVGTTLAGQFYEGAESYPAAKRVDATPPTVVKGVNAALLTSGEISGTVTVSPSGAPIEGVEVCARNEGGYLSQCAHTNAAGEYTIKGIAGTYRVEFYGTEACTPSCKSIPYVDEWWHGEYDEALGDRVTVPAGGKVTGISARLPKTVKEGEEETTARKHAEQVKAEEEAARRHAEEVKAAEEAGRKAGEAAEHKRAEEAKAAEAAARRHAEEAAQIAALQASVKLVKVKVTSGGLLVTVKLSTPETLTLSGPGLKRVRVHLSSGKHQVGLRFTPSGRSARAHRKRLKLTVVVQAGAVMAQVSKEIRL
jgi:FKBP-type peptidyl-prolyl cis-trans isomerase